MIRHLPRLSRSLHHALSADRLSRADLGLLQPYQPSLSCAWLFQRAMSVGVGQLAAAGPQAPAAGGAGDGAKSEQQSEQQAGAGAAGAAKAALLWLLTPFRMALGAMVALAAAFASAARALFTLKLPPAHINQLLATNFAVMKFLGLRALKPFLQDTIQLVPLTLTMWGMMLCNPPVVLRVLGQVGPSVLCGWFFHYFGLLVYSVVHALLAPVRALLGREARGGYTVQRWVGWRLHCVGWVLLSVA
jgi:hypothetical protein